MANAVSTAGMLVKYCVETTKGTRPTLNYTTIPGVKAIPAIFNDPNMLQSTPLSATKNHTYIRGLDDSGGAIQLTVNDHKAFRDAWDTCVAAYATAQASDLGMWFEIAYQAGSDLDSFYFPAEPLALGFGGADVDAVLENNLNLAPQGDYIFAAASTTSA
jgi:hypothetical protein